MFAEQGRKQASPCLQDYIMSAVNAILFPYNRTVRLYYIIHNNLALSVY